LSVLMAGAREGQRRPGLADSTDLVMSAIFMRWRELTRQPRWKWERRPWRLIVRVRVAIGIWLLIVGGILLSYGYWWGLLIFVAAALHFLENESPRENHEPVASGGKFLVSCFEELRNGCFVALGHYLLRCGETRGRNDWRKGIAPARDRQRGSSSGLGPRLLCS
jgi:hypothetical protein